MRADEHEAESQIDEDSNQRGKGKATATDSPKGFEDEDEQEMTETASQPHLGPVVVFSCRHVFHKKCLDQSQDLNGGTHASLVDGQEDGLAELRLACPICV